MAVNKQITLAANKQICWYLTAQADRIQSVKISSSTKGVVLDTSLLSKNLSNFSVGSFQTGARDEDYTITFGSATDVRDARAIITNPAATVNNVVAYVFAIEDGDDRDYNDLYLSITQYAVAG